MIRENIYLYSNNCYFRYPQRIWYMSDIKCNNHSPSIHYIFFSKSRLNVVTEYVIQTKSSIHKSSYSLRNYVHDSLRQILIMRFMCLIAHSWVMMDFLLVCQTVIILKGTVGRFWSFRYGITFLMLLGMVAF